MFHHSYVAAACQPCCCRYSLAFIAEVTAFSCSINASLGIISAPGLSDAGVYRQSISSMPSCCINCTYLMTNLLALLIWLNMLSQKYPLHRTVLLPACRPRASALWAYPLSWSRNKPPLLHRLSGTCSYLGTGFTRIQEEKLVSTNRKPPFSGCCILLLIWFSGKAQNAGGTPPWPSFIPRKIRSGMPGSAFL